MTTTKTPIADLCTSLRALYADTPESFVNDLLDHIDRLEAQLAAVGAGGVEPLRRRGCLYQIAATMGTAVEAERRCSMTRDDILRMAREAGFGSNSFCKALVRHSNGSWAGVEDELVRFAELLTAASPWKPASEPPAESDGEVLVRMADGRCEIAWATYWHGSSSAFAQWTFRDPDESERPIAWMHIPKEQS